MVREVDTIAVGKAQETGRGALLNLVDIIIREKDCSTPASFIIDTKNKLDNEQIVGRILAKSVYDPKTQQLIAPINTHLTLQLLDIFKQKQISRHRSFSTEFVLNVYQLDFDRNEIFRRWRHPSQNQPRVRVLPLAQIPKARRIFKRTKVLK